MPITCLGKQLKEDTMTEPLSETDPGEAQRLIETQHLQQVQGSELVEPEEYDPMDPNQTNEP